MILPDVRGLYHFYEELALRFAERGYAAVAFDFYGRTAGAEKRGEDFDWAGHREQITPEGMQADVAACVAHLRAGGAATWSFPGFLTGQGVPGSSERSCPTSRHLHAIVGSLDTRVNSRLD